MRAPPAGQGQGLAKRPSHLIHPIHPTRPIYPTRPMRAWRPARPGTSHGLNATHALSKKELTLNRDLRRRHFLPSAPAHTARHMGPHACPTRRAGAGLGQAAKPPNPPDPASPPNPASTRLAHAGLGPAATAPPSHPARKNKPPLPRRARLPGLPAPPHARPGPPPCRAARHAAANPPWLVLHALAPASGQALAAPPGPGRRGIQPRRNARPPAPCGPVTPTKTAVFAHPVSRPAIFFDVLRALALPQQGGGVLDLPPCVCALC